MRDRSTPGLVGRLANVGAPPRGAEIVRPVGLRLRRRRHDCGQGPGHQIMPLARVARVPRQERHLPPQTDASGSVPVEASRREHTRGLAHGDKFVPGRRVCGEHQRCLGPRPLVRVGDPVWLPRFAPAARMGHFQGASDAHAASALAHARFGDVSPKPPPFFVEASSGDPFEAAHVGAKRLGHQNRAVGLLVVFQDRHQCAPDREAGAVQGVHEAHVLGVASRAIAR